MSDIKIQHNYCSDRALGWCQDASNFKSLKKVVQLFDFSSQFHLTLVNEIIPRLVQNQNLATHFISVLNQMPLKIGYTDLVGTHSTPRSASPCNGIVQAAVPGQVREYLSDWAADSFVRWAHLCGFISFDGTSDEFEITSLGLQYSKSLPDSEEEKDILIEAILHYPPVSRILELLSEGDANPLSKFELGSKLGFVGEAGFTSLPQNILLYSLAACSSLKEKNDMKSNWDGSSDKYARQICSWLEFLGLVEKVVKTYTFEFHGNTCEESIEQSYRITEDGLRALRRIRGVNKVKKIPKNVYWEMLCTKGQDRKYLRTRRAYLIKILADSKKPLSLDEIEKSLISYGFSVSHENIKDDLMGLINIGLSVKQTAQGFFVLNDEVENLIIPTEGYMNENSQNNSLRALKEEIRSYLKFIPHNYLDLIDLSFDSKANRQFELEVVNLLVSECGFRGIHLGGVRKPDGVVYTTNLTENYGIILDTKAYSHGYNLPINQVDEMTRYIRENISRDEYINSNKWWDNFPSGINHYVFAFISGFFAPSCGGRINAIELATGQNGLAIPIIDLLILAEKIKSGQTTLEKTYQLFVNNDVLDITNF